jgi:hypothetical protein
VGPLALPPSQGVELLPKKSKKDQRTDQEKISVRLAEFCKMAAELEAKN